MIIIHVMGGMGNQLYQYAMYEKLKSIGKDVRLDLYAYSEEAVDEKEWRNLELTRFCDLKYEVCTPQERTRLLDNSMSFWCRVRRKLFGRRNNKVVNMPQSQGQAIKMVISQPTTFEQSDEICGFLKEKKSVIVNLEYVNKDVARRIVDFISGGVYALDAHIQKVSNSIFLIAPINYEITNEMAREEIKNKLSVSWLNKNSIN